MDDNQIVDLYWKRQGTAISETKKKYGRYLFSIANHILAQCEEPVYSHSISTSEANLDWAQKAEPDWLRHDL